MHRMNPKLHESVITELRAEAEMNKEVTLSSSTLITILNRLASLERELANAVNEVEAHNQDYHHSTDAKKIEGWKQLLKKIG